MSIYAIGDIHGQFYKLVDLLDIINPDKDDTIVFLGDYIDRGSFSYNVIEHLIAYSETHKCIFLKGNHEDMFMDYMSGINEDVFTRNGGMRTVDTYHEMGYDIHPRTYYRDRTLPDTHMTFFQQLKVYHETDDYIFVHAGLTPNVPLEQQREDTMLWIRFSFIMSEYDWGKRVIFGHTPDDRVLIEDNKICIDTGAAYGGKLTAIKLPEMEITSV